MPANNNEEKTISCLMFSELLFAFGIKPCRIYQIDNEHGIVLSDGYDWNDNDEKWECKPGDIVRISNSDGKIAIDPLVKSK